MASYTFTSRLLAQANSLLGSVLPYMVVPPQDLTGRTAIVTGSNTGIGLECARKLAAMGANVVLACRSVEKAEKAREEILRHGADGSIGVEPERVTVEKLDLSDADSVREFVKRWGDKPLDILVNNAGATFNLYQHSTHTSRPYELHYYTNLLSHIQLTLALLPAFTPNARIVNVASIAQYDAPGPFVADDLDWAAAMKEKWALGEGDVIRTEQSIVLYARVKLMQIIFTKELQTRLDAHPKYASKNIGVYSCNPGLVLTEIYSRPNGAFGGDGVSSGHKMLVKLVEKIQISAEQGACTQTYLATSPSPSITSPSARGGYFDRMKQYMPNAFAADRGMCGSMWEEWMRQVGGEGVEVEGL